MNDSQHAIVERYPRLDHSTLPNCSVYGKLDPLLGILDLCQHSVKRTWLYPQTTQQTPPSITQAIIPHASSHNIPHAKPIVIC